MFCVLATPSPDIYPLTYFLYANIIELCYIIQLWDFSAGEYEKKYCRGVSRKMFCIRFLSVLTLY